MGYYKQIEGVQYDRAMVEAAQEAVAGRGDGRISRADAEKLLPYVTDGNRITAVEQATLLYLRKNFKWTEKADQWFSEAVESWQSGRSASDAPSADAAPTAVVVSFARYPDTAAHFPAALVEACPDGAIFIRARSEEIPFSVIWNQTRPLQTTSLSYDDLKTLCDSASAVVQAHFWAFARLLGTDEGGTIHWQSGCDNLTTDALKSALSAVGYRVIDITEIT